MRPSSGLQQLGDTAISLVHYLKPAVFGGQQKAGSMLTEPSQTMVPKDHSWNSALAGFEKL